MTADDIEAPCNECQYADYSPFGEPCVSCGFDCHNFKPRKDSCRVERGKKMKVYVGTMNKNNKSTMVSMTDGIRETAACMTENCKPYEDQRDAGFDDACMEIVRLIDSYSAWKGEDGKE